VFPKVGSLLVVLLLAENVDQPLHVQALGLHLFSHGSASHVIPTILKGSSHEMDI
jgi:hypothetical protein